MKKKQEVDSSPAILSSTTAEGRENELINMAYDLVAERLKNGTATSAETVHFLKMGSDKARLENERLKTELELMRAKTEALQSTKQIENLYSEAIKAFQKYNGMEGIME